MVVNEGDEAYTTNMCQKCFNEHLQVKGEKPMSNVQWRQVVEKKAYRGRMWKMMGKEAYLRWMWEYFLQERSRVKRFRELADEEKKAEIQGQCVREHSTKRNGSIIHRPCTTHHNTPTSTARAGALMFHHPAWVEHHTGGSRSIPTVHPC